MFPDLAGLSSQTPQELADLAGSMLDPNVTDPAPGSHDNDLVPSGDTYFGQFLDHDLTLDSSPSPTEPENVVGEPNGRTFRFDLDSVYGRGPVGDPQLYASDHKHFLVQDPNPNSGMPFALARATTISYYQWIVLHEFLPAVVGQDVVDGFLPGCSPCEPRFYDPGEPGHPHDPPGVLRGRVPVRALHGPAATWTR